MERINLEKVVSRLEGYCATLIFLDNYYFETYSEDIGSLLSGMYFLSNGQTADPAAWEDWIEALKEVTSQTINTTSSTALTPVQALHGMLGYLKNYSKNVSSKDIATLISSLQITNNNITTNNALWNSWINCLDTVSSEKNLLARFSMKLLPYYPGIECAQNICKPQDSYTIEQCFYATTNFLKGYYFSNFSKDLGILLQDMHILDDGTISNTDLHNDWIAACKKAGNNPSSGELTVQQAFNAMNKYFEQIYNRNKSPDILHIILEIRIHEDGTCVNPAVQELWRRGICIAKKIFS